MSKPSTPEEIALVTDMTNLMLDQLTVDENRAKRSWTEAPLSILFNELNRNTIELDRLIEHDRTKTEAIRRRCANIANYAAMIAQRHEPKEVLNASGTASSASLRD
jgi:hypothetical protein